MQENYTMPSMPSMSTPPSSGAITIKLPQLNWQIIALGVVAIIAALQTVQLVSLRGKLSAAPAASVAPSSAPSGGSSNGLQGMVGGC